MRDVLTAIPPVDGRARRIAISASRRVKLKSRLSGMSSSRTPGFLTLSAPKLRANNRFIRIGTAVMRTVPKLPPRSPAIVAAIVSQSLLDCFGFFDDALSHFGEWPGVGRPCVARVSRRVDARVTTIVARPSCRRRATGALPRARSARAKRPAGNGDRSNLISAFLQYKSAAILLQAADLPD